MYLNFERLYWFSVGAQIVCKQLEILDSKNNQSKADQSVLITHGLPPHKFTYLTADTDSCPLQGWTKWQSPLRKPRLLPVESFMRSRLQITELTCAPQK